MESLDTILLTSRVEAINDAQKRSRIAFLLSTLAAGAILLALWNAYFSWDRQWAEAQTKPERWGQEQLLHEQIRAWAQTNTVDISLLGVRLSISDAAVLGTVVLLVFSHYFCMCLRRENHEIGSLLQDVKDGDAQLKKFAFLRVRSFMVFDTTSGNDAPYVHLETPPKEKYIFLSKSGLALMTYLPVFTIAIIVLSDVYFSFFYVSPWRLNEGPAWYGLDRGFKIQLVVTDTFAILAGCLIFTFCKNAVTFQRATRTITEEFRKLLP